MQSITTINSLPEELLVQIFQELPPLDRIHCFELVCKLWRSVALTRGWSDVYYYYSSESEVPLEIICARVGLRLTTGLFSGIPRGYGSLADALSKCPQLKHLSLGVIRVETPAIDFIRRTFATTLKTLSLYQCFGKKFPLNKLAIKEDAEAWGAALRDFSSLECLHVKDCGAGDLLPALSSSSSSSSRSLLSVRCLTIVISCLSFYNTPSQLTHLGLRKLADVFPSLRSLTLYQWNSQNDTGLPPDLSPLGRLNQLEHLDLSTLSPNGSLTSFAEKVIPHLGGSLRALKVELAQAFDDKPAIEHRTESLVSAIVTHLPLLEHLTLAPLGADGDSPATERWLQLLASYAKRLLSLELRTSLPRGCWDWLERMCDLLEYLRLPCQPPLTTLCSVIKRGKNLRNFTFSSHDGLMPEEYKMLAAMATIDNSCFGDEHAGRTSENDSGASGTTIHHRPTLYVSIVRNGVNYVPPERTDSTLSVVFTEHAKPSRVLERYRIGCLSEGYVDPWTWI